MYSCIDGDSPLRSRAANSSARTSTGLRSSAVGEGSEIILVTSWTLGCRATREQSMPRNDPQPVHTSHVSTVDPVQNLLEPSQRPHITIAGGGLLQSEHLGDFVIRQLLEVPQSEHFAVDFVHL